MSPRTRNTGYLFSFAAIFSFFTFFLNHTSFFIGFLSIPEELNFSMNPNFLQDQIGANDGRINTLQGIDGIHDSHDLSCKYPSMINRDTSVLIMGNFNIENEVNSRTVRANISEINQRVSVVPSSLALVSIPPSQTNNYRAAPIYPSMSDPSPEIT